jgi:hypothetical protein
MTPYEMEEQLKNLDARTTAIAQILPMLATRHDLREEFARLATKEALRDEVAKLATKDELRLRTEGLQDDLRLTTEALQHEIEAGFDQAKSHADTLNEITRAQIRLLAEQMATKEGLQDLRQEMATKEHLQQVQRTLSAQIAALGASGRSKKR